MAIEGLIEKSIQEILRTVVNGKISGIGADASMLLGDFRYGESLIAESLSVEEPDFFDTMLQIAHVHWKLQDSMAEITSTSIERTYTNCDIALNRNVISSLIVVLETSIFIDGLSRSAIRYGCTLGAITYYRRKGMLKKGLQWAADLADNSFLPQTRTRIKSLLSFMDANGDNCEEILKYIEDSWPDPCSVEKAIRNCFLIPEDCEEPLYWVEVAP